jgi:hypothetical protein
MAISFPRSDILTAVGFAPPFMFEPMSRQELSRLASGASIGKDLGPELWFGTFTTEELRNDDALDFAAMLGSLDGVINTFEAWDLRRPTPRRHTDGSGNDAILVGVNANNKALSLRGLVEGQIISRGDYLSFDYGDNRALHRAMETVTADELGRSGEVEVRPHLRPGWTVDPETEVNLKAPRGIFTLMPGLKVPTQTRGTFGTVSFQIVQYLE